MSIKQFEVATKSASEKEDGIVVEIPDFVQPGAEQTYTKVTAYPPNEGQFAMLMATVGRGATDAERVAGVINFLVNVIDERGADYIQGRLFSRKDPYGIEQVEEFMEWLTEEWSGNPTSGRSASTPSQSSTGQSSTGRILS